MRFLVDAQLPPAFARHLRRKGHDAQHVADCGMLSATDRAIWEHARTTGTVIISKDEDFAVLAARDDAGPQVVWVRVGNAPTRELLARLDRAWEQVQRALARGERIVEVV